MKKPKPLRMTGLEFTPEIELRLAIVRYRLRLKNLGTPQNTQERYVVRHTRHWLLLALLEQDRRRKSDETRIANGLSERFYTESYT